MRLKSWDGNRLDWDLPKIILFCRSLISCITWVLFRIFFGLDDYSEKWGIPLSDCKYMRCVTKLLHTLRVPWKKRKSSLYNYRGENVQLVLPFFTNSFFLLFRFKIRWNALASPSEHEQWFGFHTKKTNGNWCGLLFQMIWKILIYSMKIPRRLWGGRGVYRYYQNDWNFIFLYFE